MNMKATEQTQQQIERFVKKIAQKFPQSHEASQLTDIHIRVTQESGEMMAFDDDENEITRCVVEQWIDNKDEDFYDQVLLILRNQFKRLRKIIDDFGILKPDSRFHHRQTALRSGLVHQYEYFVTLADLHRLFQRQP